MKPPAAPTSPLLLVTRTAFFVLCIFLLENSLTLTWRASRNIERMKTVPSMASMPDILATEPKSLALDLAMEKRDFPTKELTQTKAWADLQAHLADSAKYLRLLKEQVDQEQSYQSNRGVVIALIYLMVTVVMCAASYRQHKENKRRQFRPTHPPG